jgi:septum formation protein
MPIELILASASSARAQLLRQAGLSFRIDPAAIDEDALKRRARDHRNSAADCALALADEKARAVSLRHPEALVIGADQILVAGEEWYDKPPDRAAARHQLQALRGRTHELVTAASLLRNGLQLWHAVSRPRLTMRPFSDAFLEEYIDSDGDLLLGSVGAYRLEGTGVQLFAGINGDYFAVLGLPLLELLDCLRGLGALQG